jgi:iron complex outermembrane receptor protein
MSASPSSRLLLLIAIIALLLPSLALADARDDARRAFRRGMDLIASGEQLAGIESLERAHELMPHPSVLYNIGLAFADLGLLRSAVDYLGRYVASDPPDASTVRRLVVSLERQLGAQERVDAMAAQQQSASTTGAPAADDPRLDALIERLEALAARAETSPSLPPAPIEPDVGPDLPAAPEELTSKTDSIYEQEIVSASRQATNAVNAPAPTTVITSEEIRLSGATTIWDLLRRVPGMSVLTSDAGGADIALRGFNQRVSNKVLVLVDGRSVYLDFVGSTFFRTLSIGLPDIERIEVIRGPGATLYGASAFGGVVNIITKEAGRTDEAEVRVGGGSGGILSSSGRFSGRRGKVAWRGSVGYEQAQRFSREFGERSDLVVHVPDADIAIRTVRANGGITLRPADKIKLGLSGGAAYGYNTFLAIGVFRDFGMLGLHADARFDVQVGGFGLRTFWNHVNAATGPTWQRIGDRDLSSQLNTHTFDVEAIYSGTEWTGPLRHDIALGGGYRLKSVDWGFLQAKQVEQHLHGFIEDRITFSERVAIVAGFRFDQHPLVGFTPSPRFALLIKPTDGQLIRASVGTAFRNPAFLESYANVVVPSGAISGVGLRAMGNRSLRPEQIASVQLGYTFEESPYFSFGLEGYYQQVSDLILVGDIESGGGLPSREGELFVAGASTFMNQSGLYHSMGAEAEFHAFPIDGLDLRVSYAFSYVIDQEKKEESGADYVNRTHPQHSAHFGVSYRSAIGLDGNVDVYFVDKVIFEERSFDAATGEVLVEPCSGDRYGLVNARLGYRFPKERFELGVAAYNIAGFFTGGHSEHCLAARVGGRVMGSASYRF